MADFVGGERCGIAFIERCAWYTDNEMGHLISASYLRRKGSGRLILDIHVYVHTT